MTVLREVPSVSVEFHLLFVLVREGRRFPIGHRLSGVQPRLHVVGTHYNKGLGGIQPERADILRHPVPAGSDFDFDRLAGAVLDLAVHFGCDPEDRVFVVAERHQIKCLDRKARAQSPLSRPRWIHLYPDPPRRTRNAFPDSRYGIRVRNFGKPQISRPAALAPGMVTGISMTYIPMFFHRFSFLANRSLGNGIDGGPSASGYTISRQHHLLIGAHGHLLVIEERQRREGLSIEEADRQQPGLLQHRQHPVIFNEVS